jgi:hypothetical protein
VIFIEARSLIELSGQQVDRTEVLQMVTHHQSAHYGENDPRNMVGHNGGKVIRILRTLLENYCHTWVLLWLVTGKHVNKYAHHIKFYVGHNLFDSRYQEKYAQHLLPFMS